MKALSLKMKLYVITIGAVLLLASVLMWRGYAGITSLNDELAERNEQSLTSMINNKMEVLAQAYGERIHAHLSSSYQISLTLESIVETAIKAEDNQLDRDQLTKIYQGALQNNQNISSTYVYFEANGFDGKDAEFQNSDKIHSANYRGNLDVYWRRESPTEIVQEVADTDEKYRDNKNEFGLREAEWYLCAYDHKKPCLMEPFAYTIPSGEVLLLTSLTVPIMLDKQFVGVTGVDVELSSLQGMMSELSQTLYDGAARVTLLSEKGLIVASSEYRDKLMRPLTEAIPTNGAQLSKLAGGQGVLQTADVLYVAEPVIIPEAAAQWSILIELPLNIALAELAEQQAYAEALRAEIIRSDILWALALTIIFVVIIVFVVRSITSPLNVLDRQFNQLASAEGDLSQHLELDTHEELIRLGNNFNRFIEKLRGLIIDLKDIGQTVRQQSAENLSISEQTDEATNQQQNEINSVVTATQEMSATAQEVARIAVEVSSRTHDIRSAVTDSQNNLTNAVDLSDQLGTNMASATESIAKVEARSNDINSILTVIGGIAEQTNLLALNAAIEAARAGEQGRGFAVVADEVRTLASRTQSSTEEINTLIGDLQQEVTQAVSVIEQGRECAGQAMDTTRLAYESLNLVVEGIVEIADNIRQVATAAEEQSQVSEEITRNLTVIGDAAQMLAQLAEQAMQSSHGVTAQLDHQDQRLNSLRT